MVDALATLDTLRNIKNKIVGNPIAKDKLASDGTVSIVLGWINEHEGTSSPIFESIRIEAAYIIAAQAHGPPAALHATLAARAPQILVNALRNSQGDESLDLLLALTRALRSVVSAAAEALGSFGWRFSRIMDHPARLDARIVLEDIFSPDTLDIILPLLRYPELEIRRNIALLLAQGIRNESHRARVIEWNERAAVWSLVGMLGSDARCQSSALYALAELARDNLIAARLLNSAIPSIISLSSLISVPTQGETWRSESPVSPLMDRGRTLEPFSLAAMTRQDFGARSLSRSVSLPGHTEENQGPRILDVIRELLSARDGGVRESACLCLSTVLRQIKPITHNSAHAVLAWLNAALEDVAPNTESLPITNSSGLGTCPDSTRRAIKACYIIADFVNDRSDLQHVAVKAGTLHRAARTLLALPPIPISVNKWVPVERWGPSPLVTEIHAGTGIVPAVATSDSAAGLGLRTVARTGTVVGPSARQAHTTSRVAEGGAAAGGPREVSRTRRSNSSTLTLDSHTATSPTTTVPPPMSAWVSSPTISGSRPRRPSFAELARRMSESSPGAPEPFAQRPRRVSVTATRRSPSVDTSGTTRAIGVASGGHHTTASQTQVDSDIMAIDSIATDIVMSPPESAPHVASTLAAVPSAGSADLVPAASNSTPVLGSTATAAAPNPSFVSLVSTATPRRRRKPPPDPALGPYARSCVSPTVTTTTPASDTPTPSGPDSPLRAALLALLASLTMQDEEHKKMLTEAGVLGAVIGQSGSGGLKTRPTGKEGMTGVLGALGSPDAEVRWNATMVVRAVTRSTSVLRTAFYDSGIGRVIFEILMRGDPDRRVLNGVLMVCCNMLNQYAPTRELFIRDGGIARLAELAVDPEDNIKLNALWAMKNMLFKATLAESKTCLLVLGFPRLNRQVGLQIILDEAPDNVLEQALAIILNVLAFESEVDWLVTHVTASRMISVIERAAPHESAALSALYVLSYVAQLPAIRMQALVRRRTLDFVGLNLDHRDTQARIAALRCVEGLVSGMPRRLRELKESGIDSRLKMMKISEDNFEAKDMVKKLCCIFE